MDFGDRISINIINFHIHLFPLGCLIFFLELLLVYISFGNCSFVSLAAAPFVIHSAIDA